MGVEGLSPHSLTYLLSLPPGCYLALHECEVVLRAVLPGQRKPGRSDPSPSGLLTLPSIMESTCHHLPSGCDRTLQERSAGAKDLAASGGCKDADSSRYRPSPRLHPQLPIPRPVLPCLLLSLPLSADSWACFIEAQKEALLWG